MPLASGRESHYSAALAEGTGYLLWAVSFPGMFGLVECTGSYGKASSPRVFTGLWSPQAHRQCHWRCLQEEFLAFATLVLKRFASVPGKQFNRLDGFDLVSISLEWQKYAKQRAQKRLENMLRAAIEVNNCTSAKCDRALSYEC